jgi:hypothetical protein
MLKLLSAGLDVMVTVNRSNARNFVDQILVMPACLASKRLIEEVS